MTRTTENLHQQSHLLQYNMSATVSRFPTTLLKVIVLSSKRHPVTENSIQNCIKKKKTVLGNYFPILQISLNFLRLHFFPSCELLLARHFIANSFLQVAQGRLSMLLNIL